MMVTFTKMPQNFFYMFVYTLQCNKHITEINSLFFPLICANAFYFHTLSLFISFFLICIMHSAFNLFVFPNYMFTTLLLFFLCVFF